MNKQEKIIVAILAIALMGSLYVAREDGRRRAAFLRSQQAQAPAVRPDEVQAGSEAAGAPPTAQSEPATTAQAGSILTSESSVKPEPVPVVPEQTVVMGNEVAELMLTSKGGGIQSIRLPEYDKTLDPADGSVELDFSGSPSLAISGLPGFEAGHDFSVSVQDSGHAAVLTATNSTGLALERQLRMTDGYELTVFDTIRNTSGGAMTLPGYAVGLGPMGMLRGKGSDADLAVDAKVGEKGKTPVIEIVKGTKEFGFASLFNASGGGCKATLVSPTAPETASIVKPGEIYWASARERFFIQVLSPLEPAVGLTIRATRDLTAPGGALVLTSVKSGLVHPEAVVAPGEAVERSYSLYIGPRKMSELRKLGDDYIKIMRFGTWAFFCRALLDLLNFLYSIVPDYGVAIILLTALVRLVLYPVNKRNAESMRKMQAVQPHIKAVQAKYKDDPKKLQAETMRIYGEHKVNPLSSCLPMLIQLPVFIALFTVLRSAVELRYASFLWIADLSQPENLFRDVFGFGVNFLPIAMAGTMALQTYLTPTAGDPAQQKMMMIMMPAMMLVMLYQFPAALGLYWTMSQLFAIVGLLRTRAAKKREDAGPTAPGAEPPRETRQMRREKARGT